MLDMNPSDLSRQPLNAQRRMALQQLGTWAALLTASSVAPAAARRLVCVGGALTEIVFALQAQADLVGVDTTSVYPESATKLPSVGYARTLSVEGVMALKPTQLIATEDAGPPAVMRQLAAAGIPVAVLEANHRMEGVLARIKRVGELTGREAQAANMQQALQQEWARVQGQVSLRKGKPVRVLFVLAHAPNQIMVAGSETAAHAMLTYAGAVNAVQGFNGYKPLTPEAVIAAQADVVLLTDMGLKAAGGADGILSLPGMAQTPAGHRHRIVSLDAMFLLGFGPRLPAAVSALGLALDQAMRT
jgi:iron complex transport system substrate-binding protein